MALATSIILESDRGKYILGGVIRLRICELTPPPQLFIFLTKANVF